MQRWARDNELPVPGDRGAVSATLIKAYYNAHPSERRFFDGLRMPGLRAARFVQQSDQHLLPGEGV